PLPVQTHRDADRVGKSRLPQWQQGRTIFSAESSRSCQNLLSERFECVRDEPLTVFDPERHKRQLHGHTDEQLIRIGYRQSRLHPHLAGQFDVTDAIWFKVIVVWKSERRFWAEVLDRPRPQSADA